MDAKSVDVHTASHIHFVENWSARLSNLGLLKRPFSMTKGGYMITMKGGKVKEVFGSKAKEKRFKQEDRRCHRSEYRKPFKQAKLVKPVSKRTAERNMKAVLRTLDAD